MNVWRRVWKLAIIKLVILSTSHAWAQNIGDTQSLLSVPGMVQAVADAVKHSKAVGIVTLNGDLGIGSMIPLRTLHSTPTSIIQPDGSTKKAQIDYAALGIGGDIKQKEHFRPRAFFLTDVSAVVRRLESKSAWYEAHIDKVILPDFWLGINVETPFPGDKFTWDKWRNVLGASIAIGF